MKILLIFFVLTIIIYPQELNPDGYIGGFTLCLTPLANFGGADYFFDEERSDLEYQINYGFKIESVIPLSTMTSLSFQYENSAFNLNQIIGNRLTGKIQGRIHQVSATISFHFK